MIGHPLGWLVSATIASIVVAFSVVRLAETLFTLLGFVKVMIFSAAWTAVTTLAGMRSLKSGARRLRAGNAKVLDALTKGDN